MTEKTAVAPDVGARDYKYLDLEKLIESRRNPRKTFDEVALGELADSIKTHGVINPLIVRSVGNAGKFEILAGARRFRAAQMAAMKTVPCRVVELENDAALEIVVVDNLQREDVHPLEEAEGFREVLELSDGDMEGLCAKVNKNKSFITKRLSLLSLIDKGKKSYLAGKIGEQEAMMISRLQPGDQRDALNYALEERTSIGELRSLIEHQIMMDLSKVAWKLDDKDLVPNAGSCQACPKRTGSAKDLFDDIKKGDRCTDGDCFKLKMQAHIDNVQKVLEGQGHKVYAVYESWHSKIGKGAIQAGTWANLGRRDPKCDIMAKGILLDTERAGRVLDICPKREECKTHGRGFSAKKTPAEREKTKKKNLAMRVEKETRYRLAREVYQKQTDLGVTELRELAVHSFDRLWHGAKISLCRALGGDWEPKKSKYGSFDFDHTKKRIRELSSPTDFNKFLMAVVVAGDLDPRMDMKTLDSLAALHKIEVKEVRQTVQKEMEKPKAKGAKKSPAKKKRKAK